MNITKIITIAFMGICICLLLKQYRPEFAIYVSIIVTIIILAYSFDNLKRIIDLLNDVSSNVGINSDFLKILLKITGIAYITEFASNLCIDSGETAIASKVILAGKILIISISIPIISTLLETMVKLI